MTDHLIDPLRPLDDTLHALSSALGFTNLHPLNEEAEKKKFFLSSDSNPQFNYVFPKRHYTGIRHLLTHLTVPSSDFSPLFEAKRQEYHTKAQMMLALGTADFSSMSAVVHGVPDAALINKAVAIASAAPQPIEEDVKLTLPASALQAFRLAFLRYGFNWKIQHKVMAAYAAVSPSQKTLYLKTGSSFPSSFLRRLVVHEIGTHIMRVENGALQPYKIFSRGLSSYLPTEEGLAVYHEELHGCLDHATLRRYAGRVLAVEHALHSSFRETYQYLRELYPPDESWRMTLRAKRGLCDTSKSGAFTKDMLYLQGYLAVKSYVEEGGALRDLYYGKIGIQHIPLLKKLPLVEPVHLPLPVQACEEIIPWLGMRERR
ncbi:DUF1704 domain-containing protein [Candidatus Woesearchaeota archaeon]|nr:DUF1704 domain-containing protein [Candidatus Woesearchaeota archaeon]